TLIKTIQIMQKKTTLTVLGFFTSAFLMLFAQTITVTGVVTDANNVPMPGVNIQVKGTTKGATTNFDGDYTINASSGDVLIFSYVGFKKIERTVSETVINVKLEEDASSLDEVVVTAFGIKRETREL